MKEDDETVTKEEDTWTFELGNSNSSHNANDEKKPLSLEPKQKSKPKTTVEVVKYPTASKAIIELEQTKTGIKLELDRRSTKRRAEDAEQSQKSQASGKINAILHDTEVIYASFVKRTIAQFIDLLAMGIILVLTAFLVARLINDNKTMRYIVLFAVSTFNVFVLFVLSLANSNASIGKKIMGLEVQSNDEFGISLGQAFMREMILKPLCALTVLGVLYALVNKQRKALHDILASTIVVEKK